MELELARERVRSRQREWRATAVEAIGLLTVLGGVVWAVAQPYRIILLDREGHGAWDFLSQPPLLVIVAGVLFELVVARPLVRSLRDES